jgi:predicted DNA-binding transcriptional regulator AlpA
LPEGFGFFILSQRFGTEDQVMDLSKLDDNAYLRLNQIVPELLPIGKSTWWWRIKMGIYPPGEKLGPRTTAWRVGVVKKLMEKPF